MTDIALAKPEERAEVADFMHRVFPRAKWPRQGWHDLLDGRWCAPDDPFAVTVRHGSELVGVLGLVTARRPTPSGPAITSNMTSWYVLAPHRGNGIGRRMIEAATANPAVTVTNFTSARGAAGVVERAGMQVLDHASLIWTHRNAGPQLPVHPATAPWLDQLDPNSRKVIRDHSGLDLTPVIVETPDGLCPLILAIRQKSDTRVTHEIFYLGNRALFARHARAIADSLLPDPTSILAIDRRLAPPDTPVERIETFLMPRFYAPGATPPQDVDLLYSEAVLVKLKLPDSVPDPANAWPANAPKRDG